ncbi:MAG TPA: chemotaxis protein CheW [Verrucomicrobiae bacterium]|nr:chemotaxis protein CheW [Verrucomicrobiae bacterium]
MRHETVRTLKCYAGGQAYCLDAGQVLAIERGARMTPNPAAGGPMGWIARRESRIPVYGLTERLGFGTRADRLGTVLVINSPKPWGLAVDRVSRLQDAAATPQPVPPSISPARAAGFSGVVVDNGSLAVYLSPDLLHPDAPRVPPTEMEPPPQATPDPSAPALTGPGRLLLFSPANPVPPGLLPGLRSRLLFGFSYSQVVEIVPGVEHSPVPMTPSHIIGLIAWRGRPVTVVDAGVLLGLTPVQRQATDRLLIARSPLWRTAIAIPVGGEIQSRMLPLPHRPCRLALDTGHSRGAFELTADEFVVIPDVDGIARPQTGN